MLEETVEIVTSMWTQPETTFRGAHYEIVRAQCDPKPLQQPRPPVWIGGGGEQLTLRVVAKHADYSNFGGDLEQWAHKRDVLRRHCEAVGRDPDEIRMTWSPEVFIRSTEAEVEAGGTRSLWGEALASWRAGNLVGTPEQVSEKLRAYVDLGVAGVIPWCSDYPDTETLDPARRRGDARVPLRFRRSLRCAPFGRARGAAAPHSVLAAAGGAGRGRRPGATAPDPPTERYRGTIADRITGREPARSSQRYTYRRNSTSATQEGLAAPSTSNTYDIFACTPPSMSDTSSTWTPRRSREPTGTGAGKRSLSMP